MGLLLAVFLGGLIGLRPIFVCSGALSSGALILLMFGAAYCLLHDPSDRERKSPAPIDLRATLSDLRHDRRLMACLLTTIGGCVGFGMFISFMPLYIRSLGMQTMEVGFVCAT